MRARAAASDAGSGSTSGAGCGPMPHKRNSGSIVASNAPPVSSLTARERAAAAASSGLTGIQSVISSRLKRESSEPGR